MGYFTFTFANKKIVRLNSPTEDYASSCKLPYNGCGYVQCPDGTVIAEPCYEGYGKFGGKDIYELVVDWNRDSLLDILTAKSPEACPAAKLKAMLGRTSSLYVDLAKAIQANDEAACQRLVEDAVSRKEAAPYMLTDWKRDLGIEISCSNNANLPFPIKITSTAKPRKSYADLPASIMCQ